MKQQYSVPGEIMVFETPAFDDDRGVFCKIFDNSQLCQDFNVRQVNRVETRNKYVLRGLHAQKNQSAEAKIFKATRGGIQLGFFNTLTGESGSILLTNAKYSCFIPKGYATGYLVLESNTEVLYLSDNDYAPDSEIGLRWNDPILNIDWLNKTPVVSKKDMNWPIWNIH